MNILEKANQIVNLRSEEKEREYGPFEEGMTIASKIASLLSKKEITTIDMYNCMIALKLSRESYNHKEDNLLDAVAYLGSLNNLHNK
jgi:DNA-binding protein H-NS